MNRIRPLSQAGALLSLLLLLLAAPVAAQSTRAAFTLVGGGSAHGDLTDGLGRETVLETGWLAGAQVEGWLGGGRAGARLNGVGTRRALEGGAAEYDVVSTDLDLLVRLLPVRSSRRVAPYVALGGGATLYQATDDSPALADGAYGEDPVVRPHALLGLGLDILPGRLAGLRVEVADRIVFPSLGESPPADGLPTTHTVVATAGLQLRFGRLGDEAQRVVTRAPAPGPLDPSDAATSDPAAPALYTVQVGAYLETETAERRAATLREEGLPVWLLESGVEAAAVRRLRAGVFDLETDAEALAEILRRDQGWPVHVERIGPREPHPANAIVPSLRFIEGRS